MLLAHLFFIFMLIIMFQNSLIIHLLKVMLKYNAFETDFEITDGNQSKLKGRSRGFLKLKKEE